MLVLAEGPAAAAAAAEEEAGSLEASSSGPSLKEPEENEELGVLGRVEAAEAGRRAGDGERRPPWVVVMEEGDGEVKTGDNDPTALGGGEGE